MRASPRKPFSATRPCVLIGASRSNIRTLLEMMLHQEGMRTVSAVSLESALLQLRVLQPDLIIVGFDRQDLREGEAAAQIRALSAAPVLALTAGAGEAGWIGIFDALSGPISIGQLRARAAELLEAKHAAPTREPEAS